MSSILILGESGAGKTRSLTTLPGTLSVLEFDPSGERSIRRKLRYVDPGNASTIDELDPPLTDKDAAVFRYLSIGQTIGKDFRMDNRWLNQKRMYDLYILDINYLLTKSQTIQNIACDPLTGLSHVAKGACFANAGNKGPTFKDWDLFAEKCLEIIEVAQGVESKNFIMTAHIQTEKDEITGAIKETPFADGKKLPRTIMQLFDVVYLAMYKDGDYVWRTRPTDNLTSIRNRLIDQDDVEEYIPQDFSKLLAILPKK